MRERGLSSLAAAGQTAAEGQFDEARFRESLTNNLAAGRFRLVIVLDAIPAELPRLVSYLEGVSENLAIDLVAVSSYKVGGELVLVPHRVEPERRPAEIAAKSAAGTATIDEAGSGAVQRVLDGEEEISRRSEGQRLLAWAKDLEVRCIAPLMSAQGQRMTTLRIYSPGGMSLACLSLDRSGAKRGVYRSVFARRAPLALDALEQAVSPVAVGQGTNVAPSPEVLQIISQAYEEAAQHPAVAE